MIDLFCAGTHIHPTFDLFRLGSFALLLFGILSGACVSLFKAASIWADYGFACLCCTTEAYGDIYWYALIDWKDSWFGEKKRRWKKSFTRETGEFYSVSRFFLPFNKAARPSLKWSVFRALVTQKFEPYSKLYKELLGRLKLPH